MGARAEIDLADPPRIASYRGSGPAGNTSVSPPTVAVAKLISGKRSSRTPPTVVAAPPGAFGAPAAGVAPVRPPAGGFLH